jgi:hypothetical protein
MQPRTVRLHVAALRFFFVKTLKRRYLLDDTPYPKAPRRLLQILSVEELGHVAIRHTVLYLHLSQKHLQAVASPLDALTLSALAVSPPPPVTAPSVDTTRTRSWPCPRCGAPMRIVERLTARQLRFDALLADIGYDSS